MNMIRRRSPSGQTLTEFAIVIPIALLLLMAVFDMGRAVLVYNGLTNAAREGARLAIVNQDKALIAQRIQAMTFAGPVSNAGDVNSLVQYRESLPNSGDPMANAVCNPVVVGCIAVVTPTSDWTLLTPILSSIIGPITLQARSELPIEFVCPNPDIPAYVSSTSCPKQP